ncbi:STAS-like domain-containing protein [Flavobacterium sp. HXWNR29]|uniref:STAS-like domain-containing protein n=1 Tax=Flavobacterium odoriferum TaxID=2946604 RepID=UPI0021CB068C|nr:STAS-like domain-containing protein [Flavobacterium sp. HXWNR29]MCU4190204.1 STAS-like domain-containing protein [Flavobacterium sp. HXWNR29]
MSNLIVKNIIDSDIAVATDAGDKVFNEIVNYLSKNKSVTLDFTDISILTTAFLNAAIGQLYSNDKFSSDFLNDNLKVINVQSEDKPLFSMVIRRAKEYFKDKKGFEDSANSAFYDK